MPPAKKTQDPAPEPQAPAAEQAAEQASEQAQEQAQAQAHAQGYELTAQQLEQIGHAAANETFRLFEKAGAFKQPEPPPPAPPPPPAEEQAPADTPPAKQTWAARVIGGL